LIYVVYFVHIVISIFLILVVLLQQGKGADLSVFGGGASQAAFGARGTATILHKLTVTCFVLFIVTTLTIGILQSRRAPSVMTDAATEEEASDATAVPGAPVPGEVEAPDEGAPPPETEAAPEEESASTPEN
jgi:preprotein translocase subunit SecG